MENKCWRWAYFGNREDVEMLLSVPCESTASDDEETESDDTHTVPNSLQLFLEFVCEPFASVVHEQC